MSRERTDRQLKRTVNPPWIIWILAAGCGILTWVSAFQAREDPVYGEWRQRIALTSRRVLSTGFGNPFAESEGPQRLAPNESLSGLLIRSATDGTVSAGVLSASPVISMGSSQEGELPDWGWRERFRWFQTWGGRPISATSFEEASSRYRIKASTSSNPAPRLPPKAP